MVDDLTPAQLADMWEQYSSHKTAEMRDALILHYSSLVRYVANRVSQTLPQSVDGSDLISYGMFGLIDAIEKFEPQRGFKFETYAIARIKGNILDELRSTDWVPRSVRARSREIERATSKLEAELHRTPTDAELADELDLTLEQYHNARSRAAATTIAALEEQTGSSDGGTYTTLGDTISDLTEDPSGDLEMHELCDMLALAMECPPERERAVLALYYFEGLTLAQIGKIIGVTESRVCQIHTRAIADLRASLAPSERHATQYDFSA